MTPEQSQRLVSALESAIVMMQSFADREPDAGVVRRANDIIARWRALLFEIDKTELTLGPDSGFG